MNGIERIAVQPIDLGLVSQTQPAGRSVKGKFDAVLDQVLNQVGGLQRPTNEGDSQTLAAAVKDIRNVMVAADEAGIAFEMIVELRDKLLEAYQELMRIQV